MKSKSTGSSIGIGFRLRWRHTFVHTFTVHTKRNVIFDLPQLHSVFHHCLCCLIFTLDCNCLQYILNFLCNGCHGWEQENYNCRIQTKSSQQCVEDKMTAADGHKTLETVPQLLPCPHLFLTRECHWLTTWSPPLTMTGAEHVTMVTRDTWDNSDIAAHHCVLQFLWRNIPTITQRLTIHSSDLEKTQHHKQTSGTEAELT